MIALRYENPIPNCHVKNVVTYSATTNPLNVRLNTMEVTYMANERLAMPQSFQKRITAGLGLVARKPAAA